MSQPTSLSKSILQELITTGKKGPQVNSSPDRYNMYLVAVYSSGCAEVFLDRNGRNHPMQEFVEYRQRYSSMLGQPIHEIDYLFFNVSPCQDCASLLVDHLQACQQKLKCVYIAHLYDKDPTGVDTLLYVGIPVDSWDWGEFERLCLNTAEWAEEIAELREESFKKHHQEALKYIARVKKQLGSSK